MDRDDLNEILAFIGAESLTDEEFETIDLDELDTDQKVFDALALVLEGRESVTDMVLRLRYYYAAQGSTLSSETPEAPGVESSPSGSNIFVGGDLD